MVEYVPEGPSYPVEEEEDVTISDSASSGINNVIGDVEKRGGLQNAHQLTNDGEAKESKPATSPSYYVIDVDGDGSPPPAADDDGDGDDGNGDERKEEWQRARYVVDRLTYTQPEFDKEFPPIAKRTSSLRQRAHKLAQRHLCCSLWSWVSFLTGIFPFVHTIRSYRIREYALGDLIGGVTVGIMQIPQGLAFSVVQLVEQKHLALCNVAPRGMGLFSDKASASEICLPADILTFHVVLLTDELWAPLRFIAISVNPSSTGEYSSIEVASAVTIVAGVMQLAMALLRLGSLTTYLSEQLVSAFTTGAAMHVFTSQVKHLLGLEIPSFSGAFNIVYTYIEIFSTIGDANVAAILTSVICVTCLFVTKELLDPRLRPIILMPVPMELLLVIAGTAMAYVFDLNENFGLSIVGDIPTGLPAPTLPPPALYQRVFSDAITIAVVAFVITVSMAKIFAKKHGYTIDATQELYAIGAANVASACFSGFAASASLSRSAVQESVGSHTQVASLISAAIVAVVLVALAPLFATLPNAVLSAIIVVALRGMFRQYGDLARLWRQRDVATVDLLIWLVTWTATVFLDVGIGLFVGVGFALVTIVARSRSPRVAALGRVRGTDLYARVGKRAAAREVTGVRVVRPEAPLYFANAEFAREEVYARAGVDPVAVKRARDRAAKKLRGGATSAGRSHSLLNGGELADKVAADMGVINSCMELDALQLESASSEGSVDILAAEETETGTDVRVIVIDCSMVGYVDLSGANLLKLLHREYADVGITLLLAACAPDVRAVLARAGFHDAAPHGALYATVNDAVLAASASLPRKHVPVYVTDYL
ncbi:PREDICTED: sulfate anion transporter 1-like [Priapulus caudatus]|uniref:Sulfate anion transporter 1-like n=1 Tax=Priapulus caudatus TaxID=37621 RepID=A0ABM1E917_PRICU|nr:PREDICTED: sulfate anion transporter 1-like [Priapulus caudatus]